MKLEKLGKLTKNFLFSYFLLSFLLFSQPPKVIRKYKEIKETSTSKKEKVEWKFPLNQKNYPYEYRSLKYIADYNKEKRILKLGFYTTNWNLEGTFFVGNLSRDSENIRRAYSELQDPDVFLLTEKPINIEKIVEYGYFGDVTIGLKKSNLKVTKKELVPFEKTATAHLLISLINKKEETSKIVDEILKFAGYPILGKILGEGIKKGGNLLEKTLNEAYEEWAKKERERINKLKEKFGENYSIVRIPIYCEAIKSGNIRTGLEIFIKLKPKQTRKESIDAVLYYEVGTKWPRDYGDKNIRKIKRIYRFKIR